MSRSDAEPVRVRLAASVDVSSPPYPGALPAPPKLPPAAAEAPTDRHYGRLADGVRRLRATARTFKVTDRTLLVVGGILAPIGLLVIIIGWWGAAHSPFLFQQVPYLISGGLLGLALVILGSFLYFGYWLTQVVKEQRHQAATIVEAIERLERSTSALRDPIRHNGHGPVVAAAAPPADAVGGAHGTAAVAAAGAGDVAGRTAVAASAPAPATVLVATARGSMAHRPDCVVVAGKSGLRQVTASDGLAPCKLCGPYTG